ncbi:hypothetical protein EOL70_13430 [Leucothrix sargassi]|nr:hypothetical protein EOL70_13430 [Leucothrix sargassi]
MSWRKFMAAHNKRAGDNKSSAPKPVVVPAVQPTGDGEYAIYQAQCKADWDGLKAEPDHAERDRRKPALLDKYRDYLTAFMESEETQNDVLVMNIVWAGDAKDWLWLEELADFAVRTHQVFSLFKSDPMHIAADAVFIEAERVFKLKQEQQDFTDSVFEVFNRIFKDRVLTGTWSFNKSLKARYYKLSADLPASNETKLEYYEIANDLKNDIGVKGRIKDLKRLLNGQANGGD